MLRPQSRILIVDDEPPLRKALRASLTAAGFAAEEARTGEEAVAVVKQCPFDLVLLDINMPGLSGFEACRRIRALGLRTGIVVVTVRDAEDDKVRCLEQGADDYITKPFGLRELIARLRAVLRRTQADNAAQAVLQASDWKSTSSGAFYLARENKLILRPKYSNFWPTWCVTSILPSLT